MRILLVEFTSAISGGERSLLELVRGLRATGHELTLACPAGPLADHAAELGVTVRAIPTSQLTFRLHPVHTPRGLARMAGASWQLRALVRGLRPDVVHANSIRAGLLAIPGTRGTAPLVVHCRDALPGGPVGAVVRFVVLAGVDGVVAISRHVATSFAGECWDACRVAVVDNAVDLARFDPAAVQAPACRAALGVEGVVVSVIAQITPWKGQDLAIRALAELRRRGLDAVLLLAGEAKFVGGATRYDNRAYERDLRALVAELGLGDDVRFLGECPDARRILAATDVLLVPSTEEPFGRTIIEAMAMGVPVCATDVGGPPEILARGVGGRVVHGREPARWADTVAELLRTSPDARTAARQAADARFSPERHALSMVAVYESAIRHRLASARGAAGILDRLLHGAAEHPSVVAGARWRVRRALVSAVHISRLALSWRLPGTSVSGVLSRLWLWQVWRRTVRRAVTIRCVDGSLLLAPPWSRMASHVAAAGLTEHDEALFVLDLLRPHDLFVDVGANIGFYTVVAGRRGARVVAFEPSAGAMDVCRRNVALNDLGATVALREAACGRRTGRIGFSTGLDIGNHVVVGGDADLDVELTTLDEELAGRSAAITMLKVDAEGHDLDVLRGSMSAVRRLLPVIMVEIWAGGAEERCLLDPLGYRAYRYCADERVLEPVSPGFTGQGNLLFICDSVLPAVAGRVRSSVRPALSAPAILWRSTSRARPYRHREL